MQKAHRTVENRTERERKRLTRLVFIRRFDLSATGTVFLVFFSSQPFVPSKLFWALKGKSDNEEKLLTVWFNSTFNLLQIFLERIETRGAFMSCGKYVLENSLLMDTQSMSAENRKLLLEVFNEIKTEKLPCILQQLENRNNVRVKIDKAILTVLGYSEKAIEEILDYMYPALAEEIEQLKTLMSG